MFTESTQGIHAPNEITDHIRCLLCDSQGLESDLACGKTPDGFQVWCRRHNCNVIHIHFDGRRPAAGLVGRRGLRLNRRPLFLCNVLLQQLPIWPPNLCNLQHKPHAG